MAKQKVVLIIGLSRIGSTVLDIALGCQENMVGLGEIYEVLRPDWQNYNKSLDCTCGKNNHDCEFWQSVCEWLKNHEQTSIVERYAYCISAFQEHFPSNTILIDSSKHADVINILSKINTIELKIVYLIRDARPWVISKLDDRQNNPDKFKHNGFYAKNIQYNLGLKGQIIKFLLPWLSKTTWFYMLAWLYQNKAIIKKLKDSQTPYFQLSYENLALDPERQLGQLINFISDPHHFPINLDLSNSGSHIINGNPKRNQSSRKTKFYYDSRWFKRNEWLMSFMLIPGLKKFNHSQVYELEGIQVHNKQADL